MVSHELHNVKAVASIEPQVGDKHRTPSTNNTSRRGKLVAFTCYHCHTAGFKFTAAVNKAQKHGYSLFCDKTCAAKARSNLTQTAEEKKRSAAAYRKQRSRAIAEIRRDVAVEHESREKCRADACAR